MSLKSAAFELIQKVIAIALVCAIAVPHTAEAQGLQCSAIFSPSAESSGGFDLEAFRREKAKFMGSGKEVPEIPSQATLENPEALIAWIEARSQSMQFKFKLSENETQLEKRGNKLAKKLARRAQSGRIARSASFKVNKAFLQIYSEAHRSAWYDIPQKFRNAQNKVNRISQTASEVQELGLAALPKKYREMVELKVRKRVESEILAGEVLAAFDSLGLVKDREFRDRLSDRLYRAGGIDWAINTSLSVTMPLLISHLTMGAVTGFVPFLAKGRFEYLRKLPPELRERIKTEGFDAAKEDVMALLGPSAQASLIWNTARRVFYFAILILFLEEAYDYLPWVKSIIKSLMQSSDEFYAERESLGAGVIRDQLMAGWKEWYTISFKRDPSAEEVAAQVQKFATIPDAKLIGRPSTESEPAATSDAGPSQPENTGN